MRALNSDDPSKAGRRLRRRTGVTPEHTRADGAWALLLSRYGREDDVVFGATRAFAIPRSKARTRFPGLFINTVPVRS